MTPEYPKLFEYGIQLERSDVRVHVSVATRRLYIFPTMKAQKLLEDRGEEFREVHAFQEGVTYATARGRLVPCDQMPDLRIVQIACLPEEWWNTRFRVELSTKTKGTRACKLVEWALKKGHIPVFFDNIQEPSDVKVQRDGIDIFIWAKLRIQVKCDWSAGPKEWGGSGNLFLQQAEVNPRRRY